MNSAKKSVEKVLEIAKKHGYACVVGFRKESGASHPADMYGGQTGSQEHLRVLLNDCLDPMTSCVAGDRDGE